MKKNLRLDQDKCEDGKSLSVQNCRVGLPVKAIAFIPSEGRAVPAGEQGVVDQVGRAPIDIYTSSYGYHLRLIVTVKWQNSGTRVHKFIENIAVSCQ
jgi:hypothetical protein